MSQEGLGPAEERPGDRLDSWKEIAAYLRRDVRTVRRWETGEGLPVHRHLHSKVASVYAYKGELDAWRAARSPAEHEDDWANLIVRPLTLIIGGVLVLLFAAALTWRFSHRQPRGIQTPEKMAIPGRLFAAVTSDTGHIVSIPVSKRPSVAAITPDGAEVYVGSQEGLAVIRTRDNTVTHNFPGATGLVAVNPNGKEAYVAGNGELRVVDTASKSIVSVLRGSRISDMAITPDGAKLYLAMIFGGLKRLTVADRKLQDISAIACPMFLAVAPDGERLYVNYQCSGPGGSPGHDALDVIDVRSEKSVGTITGLPNVGNPVAVSPDGNQLWANGGDACSSDRYDHRGCPAPNRRVVHVIRPHDRTLLRSIAFLDDEEPNSISFFPDGSRALVGGKTLKVIDTVTLTEVETLAWLTTAVAFTPDGLRAYIPRPEHNDVVVLPLREPACTAAPAGLYSALTGDGNGNDSRDGNHAALYGKVDFVAGRIGQAFQFHGGDDFAEIRPASGLDFDQEDFTWSLWVKFAAGASGEMTLVNTIATIDGVGAWRLFRTADGRLALCVDRSSQTCSKQRVVGASQVTAGTWHHVAAAKTASRLAVYLDGELDGTATMPPLSPVSGHGRLIVRLGADLSGRNHLTASLDEFQIYSRALEQNEVTALARLDNAGTCYSRLQK